MFALYPITPSMSIGFVYFSKKIITALFDSGEKTVIVTRIDKDKAEKFENAKAVGYGAKKAKTEFEDLARTADEKGISIFEAKQELCKD